MNRNHPYPIGRQGHAWGDSERAQWLAQQTRQRSYAQDVLRRIDTLDKQLELIEYGQLDCDPTRYPLRALRTAHWDEALPTALVTGGIHGYETSGVHGALLFLQQHAADYSGRLNLLVVPCVSPWGYEMIQRWNDQALDPNRSFVNRAVQESAALLDLVETNCDELLVHIDLHETTDTDETEFRPALAARDGKLFEPGTIPDGFYLVDDSVAPQPEFQAAIIAAVSEVTHIAPADERGQLIGVDMAEPGVIRLPLRSLGLCAGLSDARFRTTTEVYPDSPSATPDECNRAQVAAVRAALDFALQHAR